MCEGERIVGGNFGERRIGSEYIEEGGVEYLEERWLSRSRIKKFVERRVAKRTIGSEDSKRLEVNELLGDNFCQWRYQTTEI